MEQKTLYKPNLWITSEDYGWLQKVAKEHGMEANEVVVKAIKFAKLKEAEFKQFLVKD